VAARVAILAGGKGTRFHPYTELVPKPLIPLGPEEKPLLEYIICWLANQGFKDFVMLVGHRWRSIANYFGCGERLGVSIHYSVDDEKHSNTGGALLKAWKKGLLDENVVVWYGDIIVELDAASLLEKHVQEGNDATLVLAAKYQVPVGVARVDRDGRVVELVEKPWLNMKVTIGVLALRTSVLGEAEKALGTMFDIMGDLIPWMIARGYKVKAYVHEGPWWDVGSLERYKKLNADTFLRFFASCKVLEKKPVVVV